MIDLLPGMRENVPLAPMTTIGIGGPARWFLEGASLDQVRAGIEWAGRAGVPLFLLGGGSNVLIADEGFDGLVLRNALRGIDTGREGDAVRLRVGAGEEWDRIAALACERGWAGFEALSGIPGSVGATPIQNVGAYGQEVAESVVEVEVLSVASGRVRSLSNAQCRFTYRDSMFKAEGRDELVVLSVTYRLQPGGAAALRYPELRALVDERFGGAPTLAQVREAVLEIRRRKGMVLDPADADTRSDGSFFMNPIISTEELHTFLRRAVDGEPSLRADRIPSWPTGEGRVKLSAAWLIEQAGFHKGYGAGAVGLSTKHTLAIVNRGGGKATDVLRLVAEIQRTVANRFGIALRPEPNFIGFGGV
ncbi:MAG TPA: UDP-N-acetylmuramate dehydrogenase [Thermoanaerobaculia bacterium]|nr:UDP-N-acetylmuramate dehydrogenase [Thermoanaerobaculia bacterium]